MKKTILFILLMIISVVGFAQDNFSAKFFGFSFHPDGDVNADNMPTKLDPNGVVVINLGIIGAYETFFHKDKLSLKTAVAFYSDCGGLFSGLFHVGFRGVIYQGKRFSVNGGLGPTLIFRRSWYSKFDNYVNSGFYNGNETDFWQYKFLWYGGELEFNYKLIDDLDFSVTFIPGYPKLLGLSVGVKYRFKKKAGKGRSSKNS